MFITSIHESGANKLIISSVPILHCESVQQARNGVFFFWCISKRLTLLCLRQIISTINLKLSLHLLIQIAVKITIEIFFSKFRSELISLIFTCQKNKLSGKRVLGKVVMGKWVVGKIAQGKWAGTVSSILTCFVLAFSRNSKAFMGRFQRPWYLTFYI